MRISVGELRTRMQSALNLDNLQEFLDRTHSRIVIGEMLTISGVTAGRGR